MLTYMPNELIDMIIQKLDKKDAISVTSVSSGLRQFYSKHVIRKSVFNGDDLYNPKIDFKLSDVIKLRKVNKDSIDLIISNNFSNLKEIEFDNKFNLPVSKYDLPNSLEKIVFGSDYDQLIHVKTDDWVGGIPLNVKSIIVLSNRISLTIDGGLRLRCLEYIYIHNMLSLEDSKGDPILPPTVKHLEISTYIGNLESSTGKPVLPEFLETLTIGGNNYKIISDRIDRCLPLLPRSLKHLKLGKKFNQKLVSDTNLVSLLPLLPPFLESLEFNGNFDQEIVSYVGGTPLLLLPSSLKCLKFGSHFNKSIISNNGKPLLPVSLEQLSFGFYFCQPFFDENDNLALDLPNLTFLDFGYHFGNNNYLHNSRGKSIIPPTVTDLQLVTNRDILLCNFAGELMLPPKLKRIQLDRQMNIKLIEYISKVPMTLEKIKFNSSFNKPLDSLGNFKERSVKKLVFRDKFNQPIQTEDGVSLLPDTVTYLKFGSSFNQPLHNRYGRSMLPPNLITLKFGSSFNQEIIKSVLPSSLKHLYFLSDFNQQLCDFNEESVLPPKLEKLSFGYSFNQVVQNDFGISFIPDSVKHLAFGKSFNQSFINQYGSSVLPLNLKYLRVGQDFKQSFQNCKGKSVFPSKLRSLICTKDYNRNVYNMCGKLVWDCTDKNVKNNNCQFALVDNMNELTNIYSYSGYIIEIKMNIKQYLNLL